MRSLTDEQIDFIADDIRIRGVFTQSLQEDLLDHICCFIEEQDDERPFEEVYRRALDAFGQQGLQGIQDETLFLINQPYQNAMKKFAYITGALASILLITGAFFKIMHWPGANICLIVGTVTLSMFFIPYFFYVNLKEQTEKKSKVVAGIGLTTAMLLCASTLFKMMHWPGAMMMFVLFAGSFLVFLPVYIMNGVRNPLTKVSSISNGFLFAAIGGFVMLMSFQQPSKSVTDSLNVIEANQNALLLEMKNQLTNSDASAMTKQSIEQFITACDNAIKSIDNGDVGVVGNGAPVTPEQLNTLNAQLSEATASLNNSLSADSTWTPIKFTPIDFTLYGSAKFQVEQLQASVYLSAISR